MHHLLWFLDVLPNLLPFLKYFLVSSSSSLVSFLLFFPPESLSLWEHKRGIRLPIKHEAPYRKTPTEIDNSQSSPSALNLTKPPLMYRCPLSKCMEGSCALPDRNFSIALTYWQTQHKIETFKVGNVTSRWSSMHIL